MRSKLGEATAKTTEMDKSQPLPPSQSVVPPAPLQVPQPEPSPLEPVVTAYARISSRNSSGGNNFGITTNYHAYNRSTHSIGTTLGLYNKGSFRRSYS